MVNKVVVVTGAAQGIGFATAKKFAAAGDTVILVDLSEKCNASAETICASGGKAEGLQCNVAEAESVDALFETILSKYGKIDVLVNNAGITSDAQLHKMDESQWDKVLNVNLKSMFLTCRRAIEAMLSTGGAIINIASISGQRGNFGQANYNASKMGVVGLTRTISTEYASKGIRCNAVAPGLIMTDILKTMPEKVLAAYVAQIPMKRAGTPEDIANAVFWLASDEAAYISGQVISVNGGLYLNA